jgi:subtilisin-like proprotein convertase family protein
MTTHAWEENPMGTWTLEIENLGILKANSDLKYRIHVQKST